MKNLPQFALKTFRVGCFALPNDNYPPAQGAEFFRYAFIAGNIGIELVQPERSAGFRCRRFCTFGVSVPKAAVDKNDGSQFREDKIGRAGQIAAM